MSFISNNLRIMIKGIFLRLAKAREVRVMLVTRAVVTSIKIKSSRNVSYRVLEKCLMIINGYVSLMKTVLDPVKDPRCFQILTFAKRYI